MVESVPNTKELEESCMESSVMLTNVVCSVNVTEVKESYSHVNKTVGDEVEPVTRSDCATTLECQEYISYVNKTVGEEVEPVTRSQNLATKNVNGKTNSCILHVSVSTNDTTKTDNWFNK
jgi:hypothetical protein